MLLLILYPEKQNNQEKNNHKYAEEILASTTHFASLWNEHI